MFFRTQINFGIQQRTVAGRVSFLVVFFLKNGGKRVAFAQVARKIDRTVKSPDNLLNYVRRNPGFLGVIDKSAVNDSFGVFCFQIYFGFNQTGFKKIGFASGRRVAVAASVFYCNQQQRFFARIRIHLPDFNFVADLNFLKIQNVG